MSESDLQRAFIMWCKTKIKDYPELLWVYAVANGGYRDGREAVGLKAQGVKAGVLDLALDVARGGYHGLRIELKRPGGKCLSPSKEQSECITFLEEQGYCTLLTNDFSVLKGFVAGYLDGNIVRGARLE